LKKKKNKLKHLVDGVGCGGGSMDENNNTKIRKSKKKKQIIMKKNMKTYRTIVLL